MKRIARILALAALGLSAGRVGAQDASSYKLIVHPSNPTTQITRLKVGEIFLKKEKRWPDGQPAVPVEPPGKSAVRQRFDQEIFGKPVIAISAYWQQMIFGGKGVPPPEKASDAEIVAFVRDTPGAIGYVWSGADASGVKVVAITD
jgi:ABC-type phosphate transport system substrate-binding protein